MIVRAETESDWEAVYVVNTAAFETPSEAKLVDLLREQAQPVISLVAEDNGEIIGHIMFSPVTVANHDDLKVMGMAPMAVAPDYQRKGIGSVLVRTGLERCRQLGIDAVVVLGYPEYYSRFGFVPASQFGIDSEYDAGDAFMAMELQPGALADKVGRVKYHAAFDAV